MPQPANTLMLTLFFCIFVTHSNAQPASSESQNLKTDPGTSITTQKKGFFFITPFYEFTRFQKLKLVSNTNHYVLQDGESTSVFTNDVISEYNDNYGTEYSNSMTGLKIGYQVLDGLGISGYLGVNHFNFKSFVSDQNTQTLSSEYPALTIGITTEYQKHLIDKLSLFTLLSLNYTSTRSTIIDNTSGQEVISSSLKSINYDFNLALSYRINRFFPFVGAGFTQQFVHPVTEVQILTKNENGEDFYEKTEFDSHFRGGAIYGFVGAEYFLKNKFSVYIRSSFPNPVRATLGIRIVI